MTQTQMGWQYAARLMPGNDFLLIAALGIAIVWLSYRQTYSYLHPARNIASGELLRENGIEFQDIELVTEDGIKLSAWYTPPKNGAVILVAHGYGDKRPEDFYALFASHGYGVIAWDFRAHGGAAEISHRLVFMRRSMQKPHWILCWHNPASNTSAPGVAPWVQ